MVSQRKAKKLAKQSNPNGANSGGVNGTDKPKPVPKDAKHIIGFGRKNSKSAVHAISNVGNSALCDHRQKAFAVLVELTTKNCTCKSCRKFSAFKNLQELEKKTKPAIDDAPPTKQPDAERVAEEVATAADKKAAEKKQPEKTGSDLPPSDEKPKPGPTLEDKAKAKVNEDEDDFAGLKSLIDIRFKRLETRLTKKLHAFIDEALLRKPEFFLIQNTQGKFSIVHESSRLTIVDNILEAAAMKMLPQFLDIVFKWNAVDKMPKEWVSAIKDIIEKEMPKAKAEVKASKPRVARKIKRRKTTAPKKELKRRTERPKRTIKRRSRH